jgi:hypothetical protein
MGSIAGRIAKLQFDHRVADQALRSIGVPRTPQEDLQVKRLKEKKLIAKIELEKLGVKTTQS